MRLLIAIIFALAVAATVGLISLDNPGLMVVSYGSHSWEMPLVLAGMFVAVAFALLYLLFNFLFGLLRAPKKARAWNQRRQNKKAQGDTLRGYARLIEGDWERGEKDLVKRLGHCKTPTLNYLGAAYAAQQQHNYAKRDEYLAQAEKADPAHRMAIDISRARMLLQAGDFEQARQLLGDMQKLAPANKTILRLTADVYERTGDWDALGKLLPRLEKSKALPEEQVVALEVAVRSAGLNQALPDANNPPTISQYYQLRGKRKKDPGMAAMYARKLIEEGELNSAEGVVRKAITKSWNSELAGLYGKTRSENLRKQIALATDWLTEHNHDPNVHLTLARLNLAHEQLDKARAHFNMAIELGAGDEAYLELGELYENEGNPRTALAYYKRGMEASLKEDAVPVRGIVPDTASLDSVVTPGLPETVELAENPVKTETVDAAPPVEVEDARVIEHKP